MPPQQQLAVEVTKGVDHVDIWVDANNNGVKDDDDVNIYVTQSGSIYTKSPTFKQALDQVLHDRVRELAVELLKNPGMDDRTHGKLCQVALQMVVKAVNAEAAPFELPPLPFN